MNTKEKHKWWEHLICKYKKVNHNGHIEEIERPRLWVIILIILLLIITIPFMILHFLISLLMELIFCHDDTSKNKNNNKEY